MLGVMIKDFYETFCIKKNIIGMCISLLFLLTMTFLLNNLYSLLLIINLALPMIGVSTLQYSMEQDDISQYNQILLTFPVTKKQIIQAKMLSILLFTLCVQICISLPITFIHTYIYHIVNLENGFFIWAIGFVSAFIMNALSSIGFFWLGNKKGTIVYMILTIIFAFGYICIHILFGIDVLLNLKLNQILMIGCILAVILNIVSYYTCYILYKRKYA